MRTRKPRRHRRGIGLRLVGRWLPEILPGVLH